MRSECLMHRIDLKGFLKMRKSSSTSCSSTSSPASIATLISSNPFLHHELHSVDNHLPSFFVKLCSVGADEYFYKHDSFLDHLINVHHIHKFWKALNSSAERLIFCIVSNQLLIPLSQYRRVPHSAIVIQALATAQQHNDLLRPVLSLPRNIVASITTHVRPL
ncbi:hypothetical protein PIB30_035973 [Stylosanthes scabra]|uniref:Maturase K n=1 Tax=Stylosanthes scabra TaxID=79078 RepID=A0ABU6SD41_9FABA|nr:hypothetical protein [Stylosanthes scabra]